jgi:hypothetical protein
VKSSRAFAATVCAATLCMPQWAAAQQFNPGPGWKDSYAVGGKCYCDSNGFDHGLDTKTVITPLGRKNVVQVCGDIARVLGQGSTVGRVPYNDIQCGNGPANDASDEAGCPGRVDIGPAGCNQKGPKWDLASVYGGGGGGVPPLGEPLPRVGWTATASSGASQIALAFDDDVSTRWTTGISQRAGQYFQIDMGRVNSFDSIELNAADDDMDHPRTFSVMVSNDGQTWRGPVAEGQGNRAVTDIAFPAQLARYVRISQSGSDSFRWWSIAEVNLRLAGNTASDVLDRAGWGLFASSNPVGTAAATDDKSASRWATQSVQQPGQFFQIDMLKAQRINKIVLDAAGNPFDYPRGWRVLLSNDGVKWSAPVASGAGQSATTTIDFAARDARYIRIEQTGSDKARWWSIHDLRVFKAD